LILERDFPGLPEVDAKLIKLAREMKACILTTDYNLNKLSQIQGVEVPQCERVGQRFEDRGLAR